MTKQVTVPVEPTREMLNAAHEINGYWTHNTETYKAMINASPQPKTESLRKPDPKDVEKVRDILMSYWGDDTTLDNCPYWAAFNRIVGE